MIFQHPPQVKYAERAVPKHQHLIAGAVHERLDSLPVYDFTISNDENA